jgi:hypothetical protein
MKRTPPPAVGLLDVDSLRDGVIPKPRAFTSGARDLAWRALIFGASQIPSTFVSGQALRSASLRSPPAEAGGLQEAAALRMTPSHCSASLLGEFGELAQAQLGIVGEILP